MAMKYEGQGLEDGAYVAISAAFLALGVFLVLFIITMTAIRYRNNAAVANGDLCPLRCKLLFLVMPIPLVVYAVPVTIITLFLVFASKQPKEDYELWALFISIIGVVWIGFWVVTCEIIYIFRRGEIPEERAVMWKNEIKQMDKFLEKMREKRGDPKFGDSNTAGDAETGSVVTGQKKHRVTKSQIKGRASTRKLVSRMIFEELYNAAYMAVVLPFFVVLIVRHM